MFGEFETILTQPYKTSSDINPKRTAKKQNYGRKK